jgi:hypothetical protein
MKLILPYLLLLSACPFAYAQTTYYVPDDFSTIQSGIDGISNGDTLIVRDGDYYESIIFNGKSIHVKAEGVNTRILGLGVSSENLVSFLNGEGPNTIFEGFTLDATGITSSIFTGIIKVQSSGPHLLNLNITSANIDLGRGVYIKGGKAYVENCVVENSKIGIYIDEDRGSILDTVVIRNNTEHGLEIRNTGYGFLVQIIDSDISFNVAQEGAAVECLFASPYFLRSTIANNDTGSTTLGTAAPIRVSGNTSPSNMTIFEDSIIQNNSSVVHGVLDVSAKANVKFLNCLISGNEGSAAGIAHVGSDEENDLYFESCVIENNGIVQNPGVLVTISSWNSNYSRKLSLSNCLVLNNRGLFCTNAGIQLEISQSTFVGNYDIWGDFLDLISHAPSSFITNSIFLNSEIKTHANGISASYSCIQGGYPGTGVIPYAPQFVTGPQGDYYLSQISSGELSNSPCIDSGDPSASPPYATTRTDEEVDSGRIDMGYHYPVDDPVDSDGDGLYDYEETDVTNTDPFDDDTDDDGLSDGEEYYSPLALNPNSFDTDGDSLGDGMEAGMYDPNRLTGTDNLIFIADTDPSSTTSPTNSDSDGGGATDGEEDKNGNGAVDQRETDPTAGNGDDDIIIGSINFSSPTISMSQGGVAEINIDFDNKYGGDRFLVLLGLSSNTGFNLGKVRVPLDFGALTARTLYGAYFNEMVNFDSNLNFAGDALALIVLPPNQFTSYIGMVLHTAAIVLPNYGYPLSVTDSDQITFVQ